MATDDGNKRFQAGVEHFRLRNFDAAILVWEALASEGWEHSNLPLYLGAAQRELKRQEQFVDGFSEDISAAFGELGGSAAVVGQVKAFDHTKLRDLLKARRLDEGIQLLKTAHDQQPADVTILLLLARVYLTSGDMEHALNAAMHVEAQAPNAPTHDASLGAILAELDQPDLAEAAFRRAVKAEQENVAAWRGLGSLYFERHRLSLSESCFEKALSFKLADINIMNLLGEVRDSAAANISVIEECRRVVDEHPNWPDWQHKLGLALQANGEYPEAYQCFSMALDVNGRLAKTWFQRGVLLGYLDRSKEACFDLRKALELADSFDDDLFDEAQELEEQGAFEEAMSVYVRAMRFETNYASRYIELGKRFFEEGLFDQAEREVAKGLSLSPYYPDGYCILARLQLQQGKPQEAVDSLHRALEINPHYGDAIVALVSALSESGATDEAQAWVLRYSREMAEDKDFVLSLKAAFSDSKGEPA